MLVHERPVEIDGRAAAHVEAEVALVAAVDRHRHDRHRARERERNARALALVLERLRIVEREQSRWSKSISFTKRVMKS